MPRHQTAFLDVTENAITISSSGKIVASCSTMRQLAEAYREHFAEGALVLCSSSLDFPEESTSNSAVVKMAETIRWANEPEADEVGS